MPGSKLMRTRLLRPSLSQRSSALTGGTASSIRAPQCIALLPRLQSVRHLANIRDDAVSLVGSTIKPAPSPRTVQDSDEPPHLPGAGGQGNERPPDERTLRLGKTVRILHERLPLLLASPLPQEILSPQISLYLFPSTHPHLPTVTGRLSYTAALWTAPVAWGRVPVVGNVKLHILSERMVGYGVWNPNTAPHGPVRTGYRNEKLIVRWRTCHSSRSSNETAASPSAVDKISEFLGRDVRDDKEEFSGLFIFEFDEEGRVVQHTIEHAQQGGSWERMTRVVSVTDWLIGLAKRRAAGESEGLALGCQEIRVSQEEEAVGVERARRLRELGGQ